jgi:hypothetical protein
MDKWLKDSALDKRFVDLALFMSLLVWPWLILTTAGLALVAWKVVLTCQAIALPFSILGWAYGFRLGRWMGFQPLRAAMVAGWTGLAAAELGLALALGPWLGSAAEGPGVWAFPALAALVTIGVLWLYRADTWPKVEREGAAV